MRKFNFVVQTPHLSKEKTKFLKINCAIGCSVRLTQHCFVYDVKHNLIIFERFNSKKLRNAVWSSYTTNYSSKYPNWTLM